MEVNRTHALSLATIAVISYALGNAVAITGAPSHDAVALSPTPYSADHARITNEEALPPTF